MSLSANKCCYASCFLLALANTAAPSIANAQVLDERGKAVVTLSSFSGQLAPGASAQTTGLQVSLAEFIPKIGLFESDAGAFGTFPGFRNGLSYVRLSSLRAGNERISATGGDFVVNPFPVAAADGSANPAMQITGGKIELKGQHHRITIFGGHESLLQGIGIPLVYSAKQNVIGMDAAFDLGHGMALGGRLLWLSQQQNAFVILQSVANLAHVPSTKAASADWFWQITPHVSLASELGVSRFANGSDTKWHVASLSRVVGDFARVKLHATYVHQPASYLPIAGYIASSKNVMSVDTTYQLGRWLSVFGSFSLQQLASFQYMQGTSFESGAESAGFNLTLPLNVSLSGQYSMSSYESNTDIEPLQTRDSFRLLSFIASRGFKRHTVHFVETYLRSGGTSTLQTQSTQEFQDDLRVKRITISGALRLQNTQSGGSNTHGLYFRGGVTGNVKSLTFFARFEQGSDLASKSLFASVTRSDSFGVKANTRSGWRLSFEAWRSVLTTSLIADPGVGSLLEGSYLPTFSNLNQWTMFANITKEFHWGGGTRAGIGVAQYAEQSTARVGTIQGQIMSRHLEGVTSAASGIPILLDGYLRATSDPSGRYYFANVPAGLHEVEIEERRLPVEFLPVDQGQYKATVDGKRIARQDFIVRPAASLRGSVLAAHAGLFADLAIRLEPGNIYTTVDSDGHFYFDGIPEGNYTVIATSRNPDELIFEPERQSARVVANDSKSVVFRVERKIMDVPIRKVEIANQRR